MSIMVTQKEREALERDFWENDPDERPGVRSIGGIVNKMGETPAFLTEVKAYADVFARSKDIWELGGGQLWSSCIVKGEYPRAHVTGSDISSHAIQSATMWEETFGVTLDGKVTCTSYDLPVEDRSLDLIFAFQAAHHFGDHDATLAEAKRVLRPGGALLYLAEPVCSRLTYGFALRRVNRMRPVVREDLLVLSEMTALARKHEFALSVRPRADMIGASPKKVAYYMMLSVAPPLRKILPNALSLMFVTPD